MLEFDHLFICKPDSQGQRYIQTVPDLVTVGFTRKCQTQNWIEKLFKKETITFHETGDEPLVFSLRKPWWYSNWYEVVEAEDYRIGLFDDKKIINGSVEWGYLAIDRKTIALKTKCQRLLATFQPDGMGEKIIFSPEVSSEPYLKMLLLGFVLVYSS